MLKQKIWGVLLMGLLLAVIAAVVFALRTPNQPGEVQATLVGLETKEDTSRFARATQVRPFEFPEDHGPHNDFQTEWWYYTGNLQDAQGNHFGYQFTIFRRAIAPGLPVAVDSASSNFSASQIYFAHFAVTDSSANEHVAFEKYSRGAAGLAGATAQPFYVFIEDWSIQTQMGTGSAESVQIKAAKGDIAIELNLQATKPVVLQGDRGLSPKSTEPGNASYYYSFTRMATQGRVTTKRGIFEVTGDSWMDREWSTIALGEAAVGWDWFAIQLEDGRDLKVFQIRNKDGSLDPVSSGKIVEQDGQTYDIQLPDMKLETIETWRSPDSNIIYPVRWRVSLPQLQLQLEVSARIPDQEMKLSQNYWEGAVSVTGTQNGQPVRGVGYLEMTGYGESYNGKF
jgi:predicted secreted hydrolase